MEEKIKMKLEELKKTEQQTIERINLLRNELVKTESSLQQIRGAIAISQEYIELERKDEIAEAKEKRGK